MKTFRAIALLMTGLLLGGRVFAADPVFPEGNEALRETLETFLKDAEYRLPGTPGNAVMEKRMADLFAAHGLPQGTITFTAPVFLPGPASLSLSNGVSIRLYAMHPSVARPGNFKERFFDAPVIDLGRGDNEDLKRVDGIDLHDAVILMDYDCGYEWMRLLRFGVKGFIFIAPQDYYASDTMGKVYGTETAVPRYWITAADGAEIRKSIRVGHTLLSRIRSEPSRWTNRELHDSWVLIPGRSPQLSNEVVIITAPVDCNSIVPELASGAGSAANLWLLSRLYEQFRQNPPGRSVLLVAVNGQTLNYLGHRHLAWTLLKSQLELEKVRGVMAQDMRIQEVVLDKLSPLVLDGKHDVEDEAYLIRLRSMTDDSSGKIISIKESLVARAKRDVNQTKLHLTDLPRRGLPEKERQQVFKELQTRRHKYTNILTLFNKVGIRTYWKDLKEEEREIFRGYVADLRASLSQSIELTRHDLKVSENNSEIRKALAGMQVALVFPLELDWRSGFYGFSAGNPMGVNTWPGRVGPNLMRVADALGSKAEHLKDTLSNAGGLTEGYYFGNNSSPLLLIYHSGGPIEKIGTPAFSIRNVFSANPYTFSPADTLDTLPFDNVRILGEEIPVFLQSLLDDRAITMKGELGLPSSGDVDNECPLWTLWVKTYKFDEFAAGVVPTVPLPNTLLIAQGGSTRSVIYPPDVIGSHIALTDQRAAAMVWGVSQLNMVSQAYQMDDDFVGVKHVIDSGEVNNRTHMTLSDLGEQTLALFACDHEYPIYNRIDSSTVGQLNPKVGSYYILEARNNSSPRKYGAVGAQSVLSKKSTRADFAGPVSFYTEERDTVKFMTANKRLALNASSLFPEGEGYSSPRMFDPDYFAIVAKDMDLLNQARIHRLRGVSDELAQEFLALGATNLQKMAAASADHRHLDYLRSLYLSVGAEVKAYTQQTNTTNDMLKAVVFYMALMLPFCFFLQKLLFNFVRIEAQMAAFVGLFVATFALFRSIHPAFRIAQAPEAMLIAFVMGALGAFVIKILHGRFEGEMNVLFRTTVGSNAADVGYSTVTQQAMMIGVNNMKRRRIRTALTTGTIVLVTFTMLAFTSISKKMSPTLIRQAKESPYTGIMMHMPGTTMDEESLQVLKDLYAGKGEFFVRRWALAPSSSYSGVMIPYRLHCPETKGTAHIEAILGLMPGEDGFIERMPLLAGRFFTSNDVQEVVLMASTASSMGITPDNLEQVRVNFWGCDMKVVGLLDDDLFPAIKDIDGMPLLPILKSLVKTSTTDAEQDADGQPVESAGVLFCDPTTLVIIPEGLAKRFSAAPYSFSLRIPDGKSLWTYIEDLLTATAAKFYVGSREPFVASASATRKTDTGVYYIGSGYHTSIGGLNVLIIPLLIASTIILNTMLGSVFERKNEIAIYNAVGLNPTHIGTFFMAEAFVYSVIGSIGGYLIGQVLSITLSHFHLVKGINLNFSSLSVVYVIIFTIAVVMLSTLYPAIVATKAAVPSGKRKWSMPTTDKQFMHVAMPFICQPSLIGGLVVYLDDFFDRYKEVSVGDIISTPTGSTVTRDSEGRPVYTLCYDVALAPFDLGVTQHAKFTASYDPQVLAYRIDVDLERVSGQDSNWVTTNRPFLEIVRQYLMLWRNFNPASHAGYVERSRRIHGDGGDEAKVT